MHYYIHLTLFTILPLALAGKNQDLSSRIEEVQSQIDHYEKDNNMFREELKKIGIEFETDLFVLEGQDKFYESGIKNELLKLTDLQSNLTGKYNEKVKLLHEIELLTQESVFYEHHRESLKQKIEMFKKRKSDGEDIKCLEALQKNESSSNLAVRYSTVITKIIDVNDEDVSTVLFKRLSTILTYKKATNKALKIELEAKQNMIERLKNDLTMKVAETKKDLDLARKNIFILQKNMGAMMKEVERLQLQQLDSIKKNNQIKKEVKGLELVLSRYKEDIECYKKQTESKKTINMEKSISKYKASLCAAGAKEYC